MDDKGIGHDIVIGIIGNIICSALAFVGAMIYKGFKKQSLELRYSIIGTLTGLTLSTFAFFVVYSLTHDRKMDTRIVLGVSGAVMFIGFFIGIVGTFFRKRFGEKTDDVMRPMYFFGIVGLIGVAMLYHYAW
jgi:hypothetical protein